MKPARPRNRSWKQKLCSQINQSKPPRFGAGAALSTYLIHIAMLDAFIEYLDQIYYQGYGEQFQEDNPDCFYQQFAQFINLYS